MLSEVIKTGDPNYWVGKSSLQRVTNLKCAVNLAIKLIKAFSFQIEPEPVRTGLEGCRGRTEFSTNFSLVLLSLPAVLHLDAFTAEVLAASAGGEVAPLPFVPSWLLENERKSRSYVGEQDAQCGRQQSHLDIPWEKCLWMPLILSSLAQHKPPHPFASAGCKSRLHWVGVEIELHAEDRLE